MVSILRQRSLVDKVFVSPYSNVKQGFYKRDSNDEDTLVSELDQVNGNTKGKKLIITLISQILKNKLFFRFLSLYPKQGESVCGGIGLCRAHHQYA